MPQMQLQDAFDLSIRLSGLKEVPADSAVHVPGESSRPLAVIDADVPELILARELGCDGVIAHHPLGSARVRFHEVMKRHNDFLSEAGVSDAGGVVKELMQKAMVKAHTGVYGQVVGAARELKIPLMNVHLPCDEIGRRMMQLAIDSSGPAVSDAVASLASLPEFAASEVKPVVVHGDPASRRGRTVLAMAAGTNGGYAIAKKYFTGGVETLVYMHIDYDELKKVKEDVGLEGKNLVLLGHQPGDSVGINAYLKELGGHGVRPVRVGITG